MFIFTYSPNCDRIIFCFGVMCTMTDLKVDFYGGGILIGHYWERSRKYSKWHHHLTTEPTSPEAIRL